VRYRPPLKGSTLLLWFGPAVLLVIVLLTLLRYLRQRERTIAAQAMTASEQQQATALLRDTDPRQGTS
jgi:cytochrome c-type biogenesis protein CcmH